MKAIARRLEALERACPRISIADVVETTRKRWRENPEGMRRERERRRAAFQAWAAAEIAAGRRLSPIAEKVLAVYRRVERAA